MPDSVEDLLGALAAAGPDADRAVVALIGIDDATLEARVPALVALVHDPAAAHRQSVLHRLAAAGLRDAVDPHVSGLPALLDDPEPEVRETVAYLLARHPGHAAATLPALHARWVAEESPRVRASLLLAVCMLDLDAGQRLIRAAVKERPAAVRAAAGLATVWMPGWWSQAKARWPQRLTEAVVDAFRGGDPLAGGAWTDDARGEILRTFVHPGRAPRAMLELLVHSASEQVRQAVPFTVADLNRRSRQAPARFVPFLAPLLADPSRRVRRFAAGAVRDAGAAAALVADQLVDLVAGNDRADAARDGVANAADESALDALLWVDDPRWRTVLADAWQRDRTGMERAARALRHTAPRSARRCSPPSPHASSAAAGTSTATPRSAGSRGSSARGAPTRCRRSARSPPRSSTRTPVTGSSPGRCAGRSPTSAGQGRRRRSRPCAPARSVDSARSTVGRPRSPCGS
ncbi:hypothetical protein OHA72_48805 [Dactylosporangium sp. NBC_01737]|uniref:hypothetical protein n=1 Tax=Dactylosporangium sp. NBC_01737 TaxID=2975959 RepID=UPI002E1576C4|nr:hypothetical protein OHA72_48805 [Dactylosporangium sp. NBC_01737]